MSSRTLLLAAAILLLAIAAGTAHAEATIRGIRQRDVARYSQPTFQCLNGVGSIPSAQINDDYCDCADGSDEPGTSACANSRFYCRNAGAKGRSLPSSRVNDGVCDCCDGTDEVELYSHVSCANTCLEAGRSAREAMEREIAATEAGAALRQTLLEKAQVTLNEKKAKKAHYEKLMAERKVLQEKAREAKDAAEALEKQERDRREEERQRIQAEKDAAEAAIAAAAQAAQAPASGNEGDVPQATADAPATDAPAAVVDAPVVAEIAAVPVVEVPAVAAEPAAAPAENFPYPPEYAYHAEDAAAAAAPVPEAPAAENFPYPAEYAYHAEGETPAAPAADVEPATTEELAVADEDEDEDRGSEDNKEEAEYVHPGGASIVTPTDAYIYAIEQHFGPVFSAAFWEAQALTASAAASTAASELMELTVAAGRQIANGEFDWKLFGQRWARRTIVAAETVGDAAISAWNWAEKVAGQNKKKGGTKPSESTPSWQPPAVSSPAQVDVEDGFKLPAAESARAAFDQIDSRVTRLQKKMDDLQKTLDRDYGEDGQFLHMDGACFELPIKQYTYEVCPYAKAAQKEGGSSTSLGSWEGTERKEDGSYVLKFHHGQSCWQGPQRSLTVNLRCGAQDKPLSVEEPSKCVYEMEMETPAVCNMQHAQALKLNLEGGMEEEEEEQ